MSYSSVSEANAYIETHYTSMDKLRMQWEMLPDEDKQALLESSFSIIESLPIIGRKTLATQPTAFPRYPDKEVPNEVRYAEIEQALSLSDTESRQAFEEYRNMAKYGIQSYSVGNFKETLLAYGKNSIEVTYGLDSDPAKRWLMPWMSGGYRIG